MALNECIPFYEDGDDITGIASAAVTGKRCVMISGNRSSTGNVVPVAHATAAGRIFGVSGYDAAIGEFVRCIRGSKMVVPILAGAAINAFQEVEVGANGTVVPLAAGIAVGYAITHADNATDAQISLY